MEKLQFMQLWDCYHSLLTTVQQEITNLYVNYDVTLSEIADEKGITRQGVCECLKKCEKQFLEYEQKLQILKRSEERKNQTQKLTMWFDEVVKKYPALQEEKERFLAQLEGEKE